jgi:hypothetical protein
MNAQSTKQGRQRIHVASALLTCVTRAPSKRARFYLNNRPCHSSQLNHAPPNCLLRLAYSALHATKKCGSAHVLDVGQEVEVLYRYFIM